MGGVDVERLGLAVRTVVTVAFVCLAGDWLALVNPLAVPGMWLIVVVTVTVRILDRIRQTAT